MKENSIAIEELPDSASLEEELIAMEVIRRINELKEQMDACSGIEQEYIGNVNMTYTLLHWYQQLVAGIKQV